MASNGAQLGADATLEILDIGNIPLHNGDLDWESKPASVQALLNAIAAADGLLFATSGGSAASEIDYGAPNSPSPRLSETVKQVRQTGVMTCGF